MHGVAALILDACAAETSIEVVSRNTQPVSVTTTDIHRVPPQRSRMLANADSVFHYFSVFFVLAYIWVALLALDPWSFCEAFWCAIICFWTSSEAIARTPIIRHCTVEAPPPGEYILSSDREIVLLRGTGPAVSSITRSETIIPFHAVSRVRLLTVYLHVFLIILAVLLLERSNTKFALPAIHPTMIVVIFLLPAHVLRKRLYRAFWCDVSASGNSQNTRSVLATSGVVFALLLLQTEKAEKVMNELLPTPNTKAWRRWKTIILDRIRWRGDFDFDTSEWDDGTWSKTEKAMLVGLFQDARDAYQVFESYLAESVSERSTLL
ncbi:hypothetical protein BKA82DRAFT_2234789 [Pisolithus tinctorius]|nr:hypothetical protein BKA82DRAFT_2234789 [Pisolithus tinctorius]